MTEEQKELINILENVVNKINENDRKLNENDKRYRYYNVSIFNSKKY